MKIATSKQKNVEFVFCPSPITIDKTASWGPGNFQNGPEGAFLKINNDGSVSHLVQPNASKTAPIGWVKTDVPRLFNKMPIGVLQVLTEIGNTVDLSTKDGDMNYLIQEESYLVCNLNEDGITPNKEDSWVITKKELEKNYIID